jgi:hypothetical protein
LVPLSDQTDTNLAIGFDAGNSNLYSLALPPSGETVVFSTINPTNGKLTAISKIKVRGGFEQSLPLAADTARHRVFLCIYTSANSLYIASVDEATGAQGTYPQLGQPFLNSGIAYDSLSSQLFGFTSSSIQSVSLSSGSETQLGDLTPTVLSGNNAVSAVDYVNHKFYFVAGSEKTLTLYCVDEITGSATTANLTEPLKGLAFDPVYGLIGLNLVSAYGTMQVAYVNPNGNVTSFATLNYGASYTVPAPIIDSNDRIFSIVRDYSANVTYIASTDIAAGRAWYAESFPGESFDAYNSWMYQAGFSAGQRSANITSLQATNAVLDFGAPAIKHGIAGASGFMNFLPNSEITSAAVNYASGFTNGLGSNTTQQLVLTLGTNNSSRQVNPQSGKAWAGMIQATNSALAAQGLSRQVSVKGGIDIEVDFSPPTVAQSWVQGYGSSNFANYGDDAGCPYVGPPGPPPGGTCQGQKYAWTQDQMVSVSGNYIFPEIYSTTNYGTTGSNKASLGWQQLSLYSQLNYGSLLFFEGPITQFMSCAQLNQRGCGGLNDTPTASWTQLSNALVNLQPVVPGPDIEHRLP